jgi:hypothetical protein
VRFFADAQNDKGAQNNKGAQHDKHVLSLPSAFSSTFVMFLDEYVGINVACPRPVRA